MCAHVKLGWWSCTTRCLSWHKKCNHSRVHGKCQYMASPWKMSACQARDGVWENVSSLCLRLKEVLPDRRLPHLRPLARFYASAILSKHFRTDRFLAGSNYVERWSKVADKARQVDCKRIVAVIWESRIMKSQGSVCWRRLRVSRRYFQETQIR